MARMTFQAGDDYAVQLSRMGADIDEIAGKAIYEAAGIVADKIKSNLEALPEDRFRKLERGEVFSGLPVEQKRNLVQSLGITPIKPDNKGNLNAKIGFDGYGTHKTKKYKNGVPNKLLARAVESGSSVRKKTPFVRPAVNATKEAAQNKMNEVIEREIRARMGG